MNSYHLFEISIFYNIKINLPSILYIFVFTWRWPRLPKHVAMNDITNLQ
jgi:hypothetical protein